MRSTYYFRMKGSKIVFRSHTCLKKRHRSMEGALRALNKRRGCGEIRAYYCTHCGGYHLTSKELR